MSKLPVLILFFNRDDTLYEVVNSVRRYRPEKLYLASDGPRHGLKHESDKIYSIRSEILKKLDWNPEVFTLFRSENLGCKNAVHQAIQWFFENEEMGIVLEDDVLPTDNFYLYCEDALRKFAGNFNISSVTGRNPLQSWIGKDLFMSNRFQCWGWASWSNRVLGIDLEYGYNSLKYSYGELYDDSSFAERCYLDAALGLLQTKQVNSWAYVYDLFFKQKKQLQIYPAFNMVKNIGFGEGGTHSSSKCIDDVNVHEKFHPEVRDIILEAGYDKKFTNKMLTQEYGGFLYLLIMRYVRHLGWLRELNKKRRNFLRAISD